MAYCGKCLHLDVCKTTDSCDGHVPKCKHFLDKNKYAEQEWIPANKPPEEHDSIWAKLYGTKSWQPGLFRKCSYDVLACVEKEDGSRRVVSIRTYDGKWDNNKLNEEKVICWQPMPQPPQKCWGKWLQQPVEGQK